MREIRGRIASGKKGSMPMALIAVALLLAGTFYGIVYAGIERGTDNADSANAEFGTVDDAIERARVTIESELGMIIGDLSSSDCGTLLDRTEQFGVRSERMFEERFPNTCKGVRTEIESKSIRLSLENMNLGHDVLSGDSCASFLSAKGNVTLVLTSESTVSRKTIQISADASSALPLIAETSARFELAVRGSGSALSQMIEYQLNALAASRIMDGYGMFARGGDFGTSSIITERDVTKALRNALSVLESMYFRSSSDGEMYRHGFVDLGDLIVVENGSLVIDVGSLLAQAIMGNVDAYAVQWVEYLGLDWIVNFVDVVIDTIRNIIDFGRKLFDKDATKRDTTNYIHNQAANLGYSEDEYRYFTPSDLVVHVPEYVYWDGSDTDAGPTVLPGFDHTFELGEYDLFDWNGWDGFMEHYRSQNNEFLQSIRDALMTVALESCRRCSIRVPLDAFDSANFLDGLQNSVAGAVSGAMGRFIDNSICTVRDCRITDPIMCEIYRIISEQRYAMFGVDGFLEDLCILKEIMNDGPIFDGETRLMINRLVDAVSEDSIYIQQFKREIDAYVGKLSFFTDSKKSDTISRELATTAGHFLGSLGLDNMVAPRVVELVREMVRHASVSPYSDVLQLPGSDTFYLTDRNGRTYSERMTVTDTQDVDIGIIDPVHNGGRNTHYIGMLEDRRARYSSVFTVDIDGAVGYTVRSTNPLYSKLGLSDCVYSGTVQIDIRIDVACMSAWALSGVDYDKSNTLYGDIERCVQNYVYGLIDRLSAPIEVLMEALESIMNITSTALVEYGNFMNRMMEMYYSAIAVPMGYLQDLGDAIVQYFMGELGIQDICIKIGSQKFVFDVYGSTVTIETNLRSLEKTTKEYVKVTVERAVSDSVTLKASVSLKENTKVGQYVLVTGGLEGDDWDFLVTLDPMMSAGTHLATLSGHIRDVDFSGSFPDLVQYQILQLSTDDIPGLREGLNNIVLPAVGYKCALEIGIYAKYDLPVETGLLINEVELNPEGNDADKEWVELYNSTDTTFDLLGYTLVPSTNAKKSVSIGDITLGPKQRAVVYFPGSALNNDGGSGSKSGVRISLYDTYGNLVDRTPAMKDKDNNGHTWQRVEDASINWSFMPGTEDERNSSGIPGGYMLKTMLIEFAKDAMVEVLDEMGDTVEGTEQFIEYAERVMARIIDKFIDCIAKCLVEACAFVRFEITDYAQTQHYGMKIMVGVDSNLVRDVLMYIASMIPTIGDYIACPEGLTAEKIAYNDIFLRILTYTGISAPKFLKVAMEDTEVDAAISVRFNISAVSTLWGEQKGRWSAEAGIVLENVPTEMIPDSLHPKSYMKSDLWLFRMVFTERCDA